MSKDDLGSRIKENYENRTRYFLPRRTYTIIRLDGKAFHTFTKDCNRPYDGELMTIMNLTAKELCRQIQGAKFAYVQSDEISILVTDFDSEQTDAWFDGNIQKICSISAAIATAEFNKYIKIDNPKFKDKTAYFDARVFTIPDPIEVENYFIWRQKDATSNSIQMGAQSLYSHNELQGKNNSELQEMMFQKGVNWNDYPNGFKRGRFIEKEFYTVKDSDRLTPPYGEVIEILRSKWEKFEPPIFTKDRNYLRSRIPRIEYE